MSSLVLLRMLRSRRKPARVPAFVPSTACRYPDGRSGVYHVPALRSWPLALTVCECCRASFGTTKYCNQFLRGQSCTNRDCLYLHELGQEDASFTKEEMQGGQAFHELTHLAASAEAAASAANARAGAAATAPPPAPVAAVASKESTSGAGAGNVWAKGAPTPQVEPPAVKRSVSTGPPSRRNGVAAGAGSAPGGKKSVQLTQADFPSLGDTPAAAPAPVITAAGASAAKRALSHVTRSRSVPSHATAAPAEGAPPPPPMTWASKAKVAPPRTRGARAPSADSDAGAATTAPAPTTAAPSPAAPSTAAPLPVPVPATISEPSAVHAPQPTDASAGALPSGLASTAPLFSDVSPMWPPSSLGGPGAPVLGAGGPGSGLLPLAGAGGGGGLNLGWASGVPGGEAPPPTSSGFPSTWLSGALDAPAPFGDTGAAGGLLGLGPTPALGGGVPSTASNGLPIPPFGAGRYGGDEAAKDDLSLLLAGTQHLVVSDVAASAGRPQGVRDMSASGSRYSFANAAGGDDNAWGMGLGIGAPPVGEAGSGLGLGLPLGTSGAGDSGVGFGLGMGSSGAGADPNEAKAWLRAVLPTVNVTFSEGGIDNARAPGGPATRSPALAPSTPVSPLLSGMPGVWAPPAGAPGSPRVKQLRPDPADAWGENGPMPPLSLEAVGGMLPDSTQEQWSLHRNDDAGVGAGVFEQADTPSFLRPAPASSPPQVGGTSAPMADAAAGARPRGAAAGGVRGKHGKQGKGKRVGEDGGARRGRARGYGARDTGAQQPPHGDGTKNHVVAIVSTSAPLSPQRPAPVIKGKTGHPSHSGRGRHSNNKKRGKGFATQRGRHGAAPTATNKAQGAGSAAQTSFAQHPAVPSVGAGAGRPAGRRGGRGRGGGAALAAPAASASARGSAPSSSTGNGQPQSSKRRKARGVGAKGGGQRRRGGRRA